MIVKVELHYEIVNTEGSKVPSTIKTVLEEFLRTKVPKSINHTEKVDGVKYPLKLSLLTREDLIEKIRTGK